MQSRFLLILLSFFAISAMAQQSSSKSKSKDKLYEKEGERQIEVNNSVLINSPNLEFSPVYYQNGLVYVTSRYKSGAVDKKINETFFELFYSELDAAGNPTKPQEFSVNINSQAHEGPVSFSHEGDRMYFTRNNMTKGMTKADSKGSIQLKIYEAKRGILIGKMSLKCVLIVMSIQQCTLLFLRMVKHFIFHQICLVVMVVLICIKSHVPKRVGQVPLIWGNILIPTKMSFFPLSMIAKPYFSLLIDQTVKAD